MIHKLQNAINSKGYKLLYNKTQFYSEAQKRPVTQYTIRQVVDNPEAIGTNNKKTSCIELFKTCSQIQVVLFLRDFWYELNGWEVPKDNEQWNKAKEKYYAKKSEKETVSA